MIAFIEQYLYLAGSVLGSLILLFIYVQQKDLRKEILLIGTLTGLFGIFSEYFFFQDYWTPPLLFQFGPFGGIEDFLFGFSAGGIGAVIFDLVIPNHKKHTAKSIKWILYAGLFLQLGCLLLLTSLLSINSILASGIGLLLTVAIMLTARPDLAYNSFVSALLCGFLLVAIEASLLFIFGDNYLANYFLLDTSRYVVLQVIPLTELFWGMAFGAVVGPLYEAIKGERLVPLKK